MTVRFGRVSAILALSCVLASCQVTTKTFVNKGGYVEFFKYAAAGRDFKIEVLGEPFPGQAQQLTETTVREFQRNYVHYDTRITTHPTDDPLPPYKFVVAYGDVLFGAENEICKGDASLVAPSAEGLTILAVFCDDDALTFIRTTIAKPAGASDPALATAVNRLAWRLVPEDQDATHKRVFGSP